MTNQFDMYSLVDEDDASEVAEFILSHRFVSMPIAVIYLGVFIFFIKKFAV